MTSDPLARYLTQRTSKLDRRMRLRIMQPGEVLDLAIKVNQTLGWTFLKATVGSSLFCLAALAFFFNYVAPSLFYTNSPGSEVAQMGEVALSGLLTLIVAAPLFLLGLSYSTATVTNLVSDYMVGNAPDLDAAQAKTRSVIGRLFWLNLREILLASAGVAGGVALLMASSIISNRFEASDVMAGIIVVIGSSGILIGGVVFLIVVARHALAPVAMVLENLGAKHAAQRSAYLLRKHPPYNSGYEHVVTSYVVIAVLFLLLWGGLEMSLGAVGYPDALRNAIVNWPLSGLIVEGLGLLPLFLVVWIMVPIWATISTIIYYERRIRLEGYDIEALAEDVWRADNSRRFEL